MREILFRGKWRDTGEWAEGSLVNAIDMIDDKQRTYIIEEAQYAGYGEFAYVSDVDPATVGQYTGLTDKNGKKKIFEGDIVESEFTKKPYLVCFGEYTYTDDWGDEQSACGWYNIEKGGYVTAFGSPDTWATVIGNIHDNPELMKGGADNV